MYENQLDKWLCLSLWLKILSRIEVKYYGLASLLVAARPEWSSFLWSKAEQKKRERRADKLPKKNR
jgi:hypothetical protein